jgi:glycosyltransferase involved in cell wall biosynthesis
MLTTLFQMMLVVSGQIIPNVTCPNKPFLGLVMILKDEAKTISTTLDSVLGVVDAVYILDTGSTDNTIEVVESFLKKHDVWGVINQEAFVDFATTRNSALRYARLPQMCQGEVVEPATYFIMMDADDSLVGGNRLKKHLQQKDATDDAFYIKIRLRETHIFDSLRILASSATGWEWRGKVHEVLFHPFKQSMVFKIPEVIDGDRVEISHKPMGDSPAKTTKRWETDVRILSAELEANPADSRSTFYLANTLMWLNRNEEAMEVFKKRIELDGWAEEVFKSHLNIASMSKDWGESMEHLLLAHHTLPDRVEPLWELANHYYKRSEFAPCFLFASRGWNFTSGANKYKLWMDQNIAEWQLADLCGICAWYLKTPDTFDIGEACSRKALAANDDERLHKNLQFYLDARPKPRDEL